MPGASDTRVSGLRPLVGRLMMVRFSSTCPSVAEVVFSRAVELCTSTVVVTAPTLSSIIHGRLLLHFQ